MPAYEPTTCECRKCGTKVDIRLMRKRDTRACLLCKEPIQELIELDQCDWSSGDHFPVKEEQG